MQNSHTAGIAILAALQLTATAAAGPFTPELASADQVDVCVAAIEKRADYRDATRVRHAVESSARRSTGHRLVIDTRVYGVDRATPIRAYTAVCVIASGDTPISFKFEQTGSSF